MRNRNRKSRWYIPLAGVALAVTGLWATPALSDGSMVVRDFVLTNGIVDREPSDTVRSHFVQGQKIFAFARIQNAGEPTAVNFIWRRDDSRHASVWLNVGVSAGWRTWSSANLSPGDWQVRLVDSFGEVLSERAFTVDANPAMAAYMPEGIGDMPRYMPGDMIEDMAAGMPGDMAGPQGSTTRFDAPDSLYDPTR